MIASTRRSATVLCTAILVLLLVVPPGLPGAAPAPPANAAADKNLLAAGRSVFRWKCSSCHALDENRTGPRLRDVLGRRAGSVPDYRYSPALAEAGVVWDEIALDRWLTDPSRFISGVRMDVQFPDRTERNAVIAFLRSAAEQ